MIKPVQYLVFPLCSLALLAANLNASSTGNIEAFAASIRADNLAALRTLAAIPDAVNVTDTLHSTPLHYAALYGSAEATRLLLLAGANPNAQNGGGVTPLVYAATDFKKTKLLIEHGAQVNASGKLGVTALMIACSGHHNIATVRYLLEKGANVTALDDLNGDALMRAAGMSDSEVVRLLLKRGADPKRVDRIGFTALHNAAASPDFLSVSLLLAAGADPNAANSFGGKVKNGPLALTRLTPLMLAAPYGASREIEALLRAGAKVNAVDGRKMSSLMLAVATDRANPATVAELISAGANVNTKDQNGESVLDWARKFRQPQILLALDRAGAKSGVTDLAPHSSPLQAPPANASAAIARTLPLLAKSEPQFFREGGGCDGCHHQPVYARTFVAVEAAQGHPAAGLRQGLFDALLADRPRVMKFYPLLIDLGGGFDPALVWLNALADLHSPATPVTDALVRYIVLQQSPSGAWVAGGIARPPIEDSNISRTALAIRALRTYSWPSQHDDIVQRIARARDWLRKAKAVTSYEQADRVRGLLAAGVKQSALRPDVNRLLAQQRPDGGWSQTPYLDSDAYATGLVLESLYSNRLLEPNDPAYRRGTQYLLRTQFPDGSWYVRSRAPKFQPYFQSGFPFDHDQWISSTATAWATMALAPAMKPLSGKNEIYDTAHR